MNFKEINEEVYYSGASITRCDIGLIEELKNKATSNTRKRTRLCTHGDVNDKVHEMLIIHERDCYVRPHKHPGKAESIHIIQGKVDIVLFNDDGSISEVIHMGEFNSGLSFYLRTEAPVYHTLLIRSEVLVFHETTNGPFDRNDTVFAPWSPEDKNIAATRQYIANLDIQLNP